MASGRSFLSLPPTNFVTPSRVANWRRNTGFGTSLLIVAQVWMVLWLIVACGIAALGLVIAAHDAYLNSILIETTCQVLDTRIGEKHVRELQPSGRRGFKLREFTCQSEYVLVGYEADNSPRKAWLSLETGTIADYSIDSVHPLFYSDSFPSTVRFCKPNPDETIARHLSFATPFLLVAIASWLALRYQTRDRPLQD